MKWPCSAQSCKRRACSNSKRIRRSGMTFNSVLCVMFAMVTTMFVGTLFLVHSALHGSLRPAVEHELLPRLRDSAAAAAWRNVDRRCVASAAAAGVDRVL